MDTNNILSVVSLVIAVGTAIIGIINHKRLRSNCAGKEMVASIDIENTTPPTPKPKAISIKIPETKT
jgi:hypothetical protein